RRAELHRWPAMGVLGGAAERHLGMALDDVAHLELYSCFPAAVRVQQAELGIDRARVPSVTGGMAFAGGPFNNFVYQATVEVVDRVRAEPGSRGAVTAVSGLLTKPGLAVWGAEPPARGLLLADLAEEAASATATVPLDEDPDGEGTVATYTVTYDGETPARVVAVVDLDSGSRAVAVLDEPAAAESATVEELIGARVAVKGRALRLS
ncbi:MAG: acetyl-CoA acetyltransferase, partial [Actinobacteria bacterium]|nr:acetyl-CoA acetyltransferase [Actinomycetota bacterium]NIU67777.1 acetyl-CoA acetyltransferase [Actinomycetota bacterium]NIV88140.1 acetyl-CoA acetyltransferase [Actinomycetota bacterium]NIW29545.1 acetyl-CoA acetyltransferase [Actinomycetota bacterium]NIX22035.1 acetyl-CoA acetyltransferase [Actinomycetota bacterium]